MTVLRPVSKMPSSLAGQIVILVLTGTLVSQLVMILLFTDDRRARIREAMAASAARRMAEAVHLTQSVDAALHTALLRSLSDRRMRFIKRAAPKHLQETTSPDAALTERLKVRLARTGTTAEVTARRGVLDRRPDHAHADQRPQTHPRPHPRRRPPPGTIILVMEARFGPGEQLTSIVHLPRRLPWGGQLIMLVSTVTALILTGIMVLLARRITRPLEALGQAADRLGTNRGHDTLPEQGPWEVRRAVEAFNRMGHRLDALLEDQRRMVAAVGHDLRTPITALRLRTEFVEDTENRAHMVRILDEMQAMAEGLLALTRADGEDEPVRPTDLRALIDSIGDDMVDLGLPVEIENGTGEDETPQPLIHPCRPGALTRAVRNLAENAVRYGGSARIGLTATPGNGVRITVADNGPGLPEEALERVFEPFTRLEGSRNVETGGLGLGLPIARMMVQKHGGTITLRNRPEGGLLATIALPAPQGAEHAPPTA